MLGFVSLVLSLWRMVFSVYVHQECKALLGMMSRRRISVALQSLRWVFLHTCSAFDMYLISFPVALFNF